MKLINNIFGKTILKGTMVLFLFLLYHSFLSAQPYVIKINTDKPIVLKNIINHKMTKKFSDSLSVIDYLQKVKNRLFFASYISASFDSIVFDSSQVSAFLFVGKKYLINDLLIENLSASLNVKSTVFDKANIPDNPADLPDLYEKIITYYENSGYPFALLIPETIKIQDSLISIKLHLDEKNQYHFNQIIVKGNAKISENWLSRYLSIKKNDIYKEKVLKNINSKIKSSGFLQEIKSTEVDYYSNKADVYLYLNNKKSNSFNGVIGFLPDKENSGKINFTGNIEVNLMNKFGKGERINLNWLRSANLSQKLDVGFMFPFIFKSPFSAETNFKLDKRDTSFMKIFFKGSLDYNFPGNDKISFSLLKKQSYILSSVLIDTTLYKNSDIVSFGINYRIEKYDNILNPSSAYFLNAGFFAGNRKISESKDAYYEANICAEYYLPIYKKFVLKTSEIINYLFPSGNLYQNEMFDLGGFVSLKGFDENRFKTPAYALLNFEPRILFAENSNIFVFFNQAIMQNSASDQKYLFPYGFGIGSNLETKAGIFSVSYAMGTLPGNNLNFSDSKIHIGYISRF